MSLVMYVKPGCPYCQEARDYYTSQKISFTEYDAQNDLKRRDDPTVPCIVQDGKYVGSGWGTPPRG